MMKTKMIIRGISDQVKNVIPSETNGNMKAENIIHREREKLPIQPVLKVINPGETEEDKTSVILFLLKNINTARTQNIGCVVFLKKNNALSGFKFELRTTFLIRSL